MVLVSALFLEGGHHQREPGLVSQQAGERLTAVMFAGFALIAAGVALVEIGAPPVTR
jgi:hypothetical protein